MSKFHKESNPHIDHVTISVFSMHHEKEFYKNILGMKIYEDSENKVVLGNKNKPILTLIKSNGSKQNNEGLYHIAFLLPSEKDLATWLKSKVHAYHMFVGADHHGVSKAIYLEDPEGNGIEMYIDLDPSEWLRVDGEIKMNTKPLDIDNLLKKAEGDFNMNDDIIIGHVHLKVKEIERMYQFYKLLGLEKTLNIKSALFTAFNGYHHHLAFNTWNMKKAMNYNSEDADIQSVSFIYPNLEELNLVIENLKRSNIPFNKNPDFIEVLDPMNLKVKLHVANVNKEEVTR